MFANTTASRGENDCAQNRAIMELAHKLTDMEDADESENANARRPTFNAQYRSQKNVKLELIRQSDRTLPWRTSNVRDRLYRAGRGGKTTLIDELVLRFLNRNRKSRVAILSHDPSVIGEGALLGDRATMINSQNDRVFMRSMATRGQAGGLSPATHDCLALLAQSDFDYVIIETVGTGQEAMPFRKNGIVDLTVLVMNPDYGSRLQLQKIVMLDLADIVVVNKSDLATGTNSAYRNRATARAKSDVLDQQLVDTVAKRHRDPGVDRLFDLIAKKSATRTNG